MLNNKVGGGDFGGARVFSCDMGLLFEMGVLQQYAQLPTRGALGIRNCWWGPAVGGVGG
jgi:hypothetical protein